MEKYRVRGIRPYGEDIYQAVDLVGVNKSASLRWGGFRIYRVNPRFQSGDVIKLYTNGKTVGRVFKACSYDLGGKTFVDIKLVSLSQYQIEHFYDDIPKLDALRLRYDVVRALRSQNIQPTLNAANNLRLLLFGAGVSMKTL